MDSAVFEIYRKILKERSGIIITPDKAYLLESRLSPIAKQKGYDCVQAMANELRNPVDLSLINDVIEAMTTNETSFFRDQKPFNVFRDEVIPKLIEARGALKKIKLWCAAASSGQEPYSLAMTLKDLQKRDLMGWQIDILATDLSHDILQKAKTGIYNQFEVQRGLPIQMLMSCFTQEGDEWRLNDDIRSMVRFDVFNLLDNMMKFGILDVIFCRNVLIYFDDETKADILRRLGQRLSPDGFLFIGSTESIVNMDTGLVGFDDHRGLYVPYNSPHLTTNTQETPAQALHP